MKTERLYAMILYLINHGVTPASELARHFEVSVRTVQRDIAALGEAGVPVYALNGKSGGYGIVEGYRMRDQLVTDEDIACMATAMGGLKSLTHSNNAEVLHEKLSAMANGSENGMVLDFSVLSEGEEELLRLFRRAIAAQKQVCFVYTNNNGTTARRNVEPIAVVYRWYKWYLTGFDTDKLAYRTFKLVRMADAEMTDNDIAREHPKAEELLKDTDNNKCDTTRIVIECRGNAVYRIKEYLNAKVVKPNSDDSVVLEAHVVENEQWWLGVIMSQGKDSEVLEPEHIRRRIAELAREAYFLYDKL